MLRQHRETGITSRQRGTFWDDLGRDLEDPAFARQYAIESARIATIDAVVNALDEAREAEGLSKADLARAVGSEPAVVRRLFGSGRVNPTLGTLAEVAAALGLRITVEKDPAASANPGRGTARRGGVRSAEPVRVAATKGRPTPGKTAVRLAAKTAAKSTAKRKLVTR
ncbi:MAG TPA: helix-turn-helix domain-containing protein [Jatrophihabitantaceae bacterium]